MELSMKTGMSHHHPMEDVSSGGGEVPWSNSVEINNPASVNPYLKYIQRRRYVTENPLDREDPSVVLADWYASYDWLSAHYDEESLEDVAEVPPEMVPSVMEKSTVDETSFVLTLAKNSCTSEVQRHQGMLASEDTMKENPRVCTLL